MKRVDRFLWAALTLFLAGTVSASAALPSVEAQVGTQGIGIEVEQPVLPMLSLALQGNYLGLSHTLNTSHVTYDGHVHLETIGVLAQWYPFAGEFHVDAGLYYNDNYVSATATKWTPNPGFVPGTEKLTFNRLGPYVGIGWLTSGWIKLSFDLGVMYQGAPSITSTDQCTGPSASQCESQHQQDLNNLRSKMNGFHFWPVVRLGLGF